MTINGEKYINDYRVKLENLSTLRQKRPSVEAVRYALHTTYRTPQTPVSHDCFYEWGGINRGEACLHHTVVQDLSLEAAAFLSNMFASMGEMVVVTDSVDYGNIITRADVALVYFINRSCEHTK